MRPQSYSSTCNSTGWEKWNSPCNSMGREKWNSTCNSTGREKWNSTCNSTKWDGCNSTCNSTGLFCYIHDFVTYMIDFLNCSLLICQAVNCPTFPLKTQSTKVSLKNPIFRVWIGTNRIFQEQWHSRWLQIWFWGMHMSIMEEHSCSRLLNFFSWTIFNDFLELYHV